LLLLAEEAGVNLTAAITGKSDASYENDER
jgi:hypothetical protein